MSGETVRFLTQEDRALCVHRRCGRPCLTHHLSLFLDLNGTLCMFYILTRPGANGFFGPIMTTGNLRLQHSLRQKTSLR